MIRIQYEELTGELGNRIQQNVRPSAERMGHLMKKFHELVGLVKKVLRERGDERALVWSIIYVPGTMDTQTMEHADISVEMFEMKNVLSHDPNSKVSVGSAVSKNLLLSADHEDLRKRAEELVNGLYQ